MGVGVLPKCLQHGETQGTTANAHNVVVDGSEHELELLGNLVTVGGILLLGASGGGGGDLRVSGGLGNDRHVGELAVVGRTHGVNRHEVKGVSVHVVASLLGDGDGVVEGSHQREVVHRHLGETLGVLVRQVDVRHGVAGQGGVEHNTGVAAVEGIGGGGGVVRPLSGVGGVADAEEQSLDGVRHTQVIGLVGSGHVRGGGQSLHLLDEHVAGVLTHHLALVVGHDSVVGPHLNVAELGGDTTIDIGKGSGARVTSGNVTNLSGSGVIHNEKLSPVAEAERNLHLVVGEGSGGESHTGVAGVAVGEGQVKSLSGNQHTLEEVVTKGGSGTDGGGVEDLNLVTNHVVVTHALAGGHGEGRPEVEVVVVQAELAQVVEGDEHLLNKVVHKVASPAQTEALGGLLGVHADRGDGHAQPVVKHVVTGARDRHAEVAATELGGSVRVLKLNRHVGEPGASASLAHEVGDSRLAAVVVFLELVVSSKVNETRSDISAALSHLF